MTQSILGGNGHCNELILWRQKICNLDRQSHKVRYKSRWAGSVFPLFTDEECRHTRDRDRLNAQSWRGAARSVKVETPPAHSSILAHSQKVTERWVIPFTSEQIISRLNSKLHGVACTSGIQDLCFISQTWKTQKRYTKYWKQGLFVCYSAHKQLLLLIHLISNPYNLYQFFGSDQVVGH